MQSSYYQNTPPYIAGCLKLQIYKKNLYDEKKHPNFTLSSPTIVGLGTELIRTWVGLDTELVLSVR